MEHSKTPSSPLVDLGREDIDPWNEFLSESSEEFQGVQSESAIDQSATVPPEVSTDSVGGSSATFEDIAAHDHRASAVDGTDRVVRVSIAEVTPDVAADVFDAPAHAPSGAAWRDRESFHGPGSQGRAIESDAPRASVSSVSLAEALNRAVEQSRAATVPSRGASAASPAAAESISLREVLRRHTPMHWSEAVATVEGLCLELSAAGRTPLIPDLADISITADGYVVLRPDASGDPDVATLGRTLHALLVTATTPLPLRLFVTSSVSSDRYKSVSLFLEALSYYAAPDREALIQSLYARALVSVAPMAPPSAPVVTPQQAPPQIPQASDRPVAPARRSLRAAAIGICAGIILGTVAAFWLWPATPQPRATITQSAPTPSAQPPRDDWEPAPVQVPPDVKSRRPVVARTPAASARRETVVPPPIPATSMPSPIHPLPAPVVVSAPPRVEAFVQEPRSVPPQPAPAATPTAVATGAALVERTIYSDADREVTPPVLLSRRPLPPPEASREGVNGPTLYELLVDQKGEVETSRLVGRPSRMTDMNTLQATKNLLFRPASKDGHAVRFRYVLRLEGSPR